jgi:hypothetical protein
MKDGFVKSSPRFFRLIAISGGFLVVLLAGAAFLVPAPLQPPADASLTPNPAKSAWFLLWIQELVSWSRLMIYPVLLSCLVFGALPWIAGERRFYRARWFPREQRWLNLAAVAAVFLLLALTVIAAFFRGADWRLLW